MIFAVKKKRTPSIAPKRHAPTVSPMYHSLHLQQAKVRHILRSLTFQPKLTIGQPNDKYEQEADRVADEVMRMPEPGVQRQVEPEEEEEEEETLQPKPLVSQITPLVQVQRQEEPEEEEETLQAKPLADQITPLLQRQEESPEDEKEPVQAKTTSGSAPEVTPEIGSGIQSLRGGGRPLSKSERCFFEPRFGVGFGDVRVHNDTRAARAARSVNARAFTLGRDVVFGTGEYTSGVGSGRRLLAHELSHVVQQSKSKSSLGVQRLVGFEFEMNYSAETREPHGSPATASGLIRPITNHFKIEMDGNRLEATTDPKKGAFTQHPNIEHAFPETNEGRQKLADCMDALVTLADTLKSKCDMVRVKRGRPRWFKPPPGLFATSVKAVYPIGSKGRYRKGCGVGASPQATLGIRLDKFGQLVKHIKKSERGRMPLSGSRLTRTGKRRRLGIRSTILYEAKTNVYNSRRRELRKTHLPNGKVLNATNFSVALANFMTLLVSYLRTSVRLDSADRESYAKAYPPIVAHSDFTKIYNQLLNNDEREVFKKLYGNNRREIFKLAAYKGLGGATTKMFPPKLMSTITWNEVVDSVLNNRALHLRLTPHATEFGPEEVGVPGSGMKGMVVELRRMGYTWRPVSVWKKLALHIFDQVRRLNK
jgi:hypothetical protein